MCASVTPIAVEAIEPWREAYRREMNCQIVHDSLHARAGWTQHYLLALDGEAAGYGAVAVGGPWAGKPSIFELFIEPRWRCRAFDLFDALRRASAAVAMDAQTSDALLTVMLHAFATNVVVDRILFHDALQTARTAPPGCVFRSATPDDGEAMRAQRLDMEGEWVVEVDGALAGAGGVALHYNEPYADIYMEILPAFRRRGVGAYLTQGLKRACREMGREPCARCRPNNIASRRTLAKAGFAPFGLILTGALPDSA